MCWAFSIGFVRWFGFEDGGILEERGKVFSVTQLLVSVMPRKDALRINPAKTGGGMPQRANLKSVRAANISKMFQK